MVVKMIPENDVKNNKKNNKKRIYQILMVLFLLGFCISMVVVIRNAIIEKRAESQYEQLVGNTVSTETETEIITVETETESEEESILKEYGIEIPVLELDWEELAKTNSDIYSWVYIPDTKVNYPVLQHSEKTDYYLDHNLDHSKGLPGCIYTQLLNKKDYTDRNTILYGHNMKDGTMFKGLHQFADSTFFKENRYIYIYTPEKVFVYEIYAACEVSDAHLLYKYNFNKAEGAANFLEDIKTARSMNKQVVEEIELPEEIKLITLSTCIANKPNNRWIVVGVLLGEEIVED